MKRNLLLISLFPFTVTAADIGVSWSVSELNQPVQVGPSEDNISALNNNVQLNYSTQDWLFGVALSKADTDDKWTEQSVDTDSDLNFESYEFYTNYYTGNWTFAAAVGQSDIAYRIIKVRHFGSGRENFVDRRDLQEYDNEDRFFEFSTRYYLDLSGTITDLSVDFEASATRFNTQGQQRSESRNIQVSNDPRVDRFIADNGVQLGVQSAGGFVIDEAVWIYSAAINFDYAFNIMNKDWLASVWYEAEFSNQSDGSFTVSRLRDNHRVIRREFPLSEAGEQSSLDNLNSYGIDLNLALSDSFSAHLSWLDSDLGQSQMQFGLSYWF